MRFGESLINFSSAKQAQAARNYTYDAPNDPALQKLWALLCTGRAGQCGVLRAACSERAAALPEHRCSEAVDAPSGRQ